MSFWIAFWAVVFAVAAGGFALLAVVVGIGGIGDLRALFRGIKAQHERDADGKP